MLDNLITEISLYISEHPMNSAILMIFLLFFILITFLFRKSFEKDSIITELRYLRRNASVYIFISFGLFGLYFTIFVGIKNCFKKDELQVILFPYPSLANRNDDRNKVLQRLKHEFELNNPKISLSIRFAESSSNVSGVDEIDKLYPDYDIVEVDSKFLSKPETENRIEEIKLPQSDKLFSFAKQAVENNKKVYAKPTFIQLMYGFFIFANTITLTCSQQKEQVSTDDLYILKTGETEKKVIHKKCTEKPKLLTNALVVRKKCKGICKDRAYKFLNYYTESNTVEWLALGDERNRSSKFRYLLPSQKDFYENGFITKDNNYKNFYSILKEEDLKSSLINNP